MKYPLIALPLSTLLVLTGCGGSSSGGDDADVPTVTVTAPATAVTTIAFNVAWASTNATSCSSTFSSGTTASGSAEVTATVAGNTTYSVTCTGPGGSATGSASVAITEIANAQGLWQGDATGNGGTRTFAGVVTDEDQYWLVYNGVDATAGDPAGFFVGTGNTTNTSATAGTFNGNGLIEFNFETLGSAVGTLQANFTGKSTLDGTATTAVSHMTGTQVYGIDGFDANSGTILTTNPDPVSFTDGGSAWTITPNVNDPGAAPSLAGALHFTDYNIHLEIPLSVTSIIDVKYGSRVLTVTHGPDYAITYDGNISVSHPNPTLLVTGVEFQDSITTPDCTDNGGGAFCAFIPSTVAHGDILITFDNTNLDTYTGEAHAYQEVNAPGVIDPIAGGTCINDTYGIATDPPNNGNANTCANATFTFSGTIPASASTTITQTFTSTYNTAYDTAAAVATVAGSYTGNAGVGSVLEANSTLVIAANGTITGTTATSACAITGTVAAHGNKNVYDVTNLVFADNGGSTCTLVGQTFKGVATYDASGEKVTVTAANNAKSKGFLFVGSKAQAN